MEVIWPLIKDAGPFALAAAFFYMAMIERERFDKERALNEVRTDKLYDLGVSTRDAWVTANKLLEAAMRRIAEDKK